MALKTAPTPTVAALPTDGVYQPSNTGLSMEGFRGFAEFGPSSGNGAFAEFIDGAGNGVAAQLRPGGNDVGWWFYPVVNFVKGSTPSYTSAIGPYVSNTEPTTTVIYRAGTIDILAGDTKLGTQTGLPAACNFVRVKALNVVRNARYGALATPILVNKTTLLADFRVRMEIEYTNLGDQANVPNVQLYAADGTTPVGAKAPAILISNSPAGSAIIESASAYTAAHYGTITKPKLFEVVNGQETGATAPLELTMPSGPMTMTVNPVGTIFFYSVDPFANKFNGMWASGGTFQGPDSATPDIAYDGNLLDTTRTRGAGVANWRMANPSVSGQKFMYMWQGDMPNQQITSDGGTTVMRSVSAVQTLNGFNYRTFYYDYDYAAFINRNGLNDASFARFYHDTTASAANWPKNIQLYEINEQNERTSPGKFDERYLTEYRRFNTYPFAMRLLDWFNTSGNSYTVFSRVSQAGDKAGTGRHSFVDALDMLTATGNTGKLQFPLQATEAVIRAEARRMAVWAKVAQKPISPRVSNEVWNPGQGAWQQSVALGKAAVAAGTYALQSDTSDNGYAVRYWAYRNKQVMQWTTEEFAAEGALQWLVRGIEVQNDTGGNGSGALFNSEPDHLDYIDVIESAPYVGNGKGTGLTADAAGLATLRGRLRADWPIIFERAAGWRDKALSLGKKFGNYEGMFEDFKGGKALWLAFNADPLTYDLVTDMLNDYETIVGGQYALYNDVRADAYGYRLHITQPLADPPAGVPISYVDKAVRDKMAQLAGP
ncbi:MAG TPA: hypothetical protein VF637_17285 [Sphingomicrobium sp.]